MKRGLIISIVIIVFLLLAIAFLFLREPQSDNNPPINTQIGEFSKSSGENSTLMGVDITEWGYYNGAYYYTVRLYEANGRESKCPEEQQSGSEVCADPDLTNPSDHINYFFEYELMRGKRGNKIYLNGNTIYEFSSKNQYLLSWYTENNKVVTISHSPIPITEEGKVNAQKLAELLSSEYPINNQK